MELILDRELSCGVKEKSSTRGNPNLGVLEELRRKKGETGLRESGDKKEERAEESRGRKGVTEEWNVQRERKNGGVKRRFKQRVSLQLENWNPKPG